MKIAGYATRAELLEALQLLRVQLPEPMEMFGSPHELLLAAERAGFEIILVELRDVHGHPTTTLIETLRRHSEVFLVGLMPLGEVGDLLSLPDAIRSGLHDLILVDKSVEDLLGLLTACVDRISIRHTIADTEDVLRGALHQHAFSLMHLCLRGATAQFNAQQLSTMAGMHRVTLARQFLQAGLPSPATSYVGLDCSSRLDFLYGVLGLPSILPA